MRIFPALTDVKAAANTVIGTSGWHLIDQDRINAFATVTGDHQWIHTDPQRMRKELDMTTIAHGFLTLSMIPVFMLDVFTVTSVKRIINYGANKIRFTNMVPVNSRICGHVFLKRASGSAGRLRTISEVTVEIEGKDKPALVAEMITLWFEQEGLDDRQAGQQ